MLWDIYPGDTLLGQKVYVFLTLINIVRLLSEEAVSICISTSSAKNTFFHISPLTMISLFKIFASLIGLKGWFVVNSVFNFPISEFKQHIYMYLLAIWICSSVNCLFISVARFPLRLLPVSCRFLKLSLYNYSF